MMITKLKILILTGVLSTPIIAGCGLGAADDSAPLTVFDNFRVIEPGKAYRSAQLDATSLALVLDEYDIKTVINLRGENEDEAWYQAETRVASEMGVEHIDIRMSASRLPPREVLLQLYDTFQSAEHPILMHCQAGADRTGAAAAIWRMVVNEDPKPVAAFELSIIFGHFTARYPEMDRLVRMFEPSREWIESQYPVE